MVDPSGVSTLDELAGLLRDLRRRQARRVRSSPLTFGELAARTGWPGAAIGAYFAGRALPPAERLDALLRLLGASPAECGAFASARSRIAARDGAVAPASLAPASPPTSASSVAPASSLPRSADEHGLPAAPAYFAGRAGVIARLDRMLPGARAVFVGGDAGVGKTALAVHYGHRIAGRFPDGVLFLDLRGSDPAGPLPAAEALRTLLAALGVAPADMPLGLAARTGMYRGLTARRGVLLVLDDAADAAQLRPLVPAVGDSVALVTGRHGPAGPAGLDAAGLTLDVFDRTEARAVLAARIGAERTAAEPAAVDRIITACGRRPMALAVFSARAALLPELSLAAAADALAERTAFAWSYDLLSPAARRLFRGFGAHPGPDLSEPDATILLGRSSVDALSELARAQLVAEPRPGRYAMHAVLREHAAGGTPDAERAGLQDRLVAHHAAHAGGHRATLAVLGLAIRRGRYGDAWRIAEALDGPLDAAGRWDDRIAVAETAIRAAELLGDPALLARAQRAQSAAYLRTGQHEAALRRLREAADCFHAQGEAGAAAACRQDLAAVLESMARFTEAIVHGELALALFRRAGDGSGEASARAAAAWHYAQAGRAAEAVAHGEGALALRRELGDPHETAAAVAHLGRVHSALGDRERSVERYREALERFTELGDRLDEAETATRLGDALDGAPAIGLWRRALAIYERVDHPSASAVEARLGL
ncbi:tetratricopeptide repeat protein [Dactylosporangium sp. NPDC048998]|uniref:tetratricopeptide repeat protein n=1 Tax=Dactylosporangium sp. NPDC048998 TaxID=3363976 RepID=UPI0037200E93